MNIDKAKKYLGYTPLVPYEEGVRRARAAFAPRILPAGERTWNFVKPILICFVVLLFVLWLLL